MSNLSCGTHVAEPPATFDCRKLPNQDCRFLPKLKLPISAEAKLPLTTGPGEYYLDSIALRPEFRGHDMGLDILRDTILKAREKGFRRFTLIVDVDAPRKIAYYSRLGFKPGCTMETFGSTYLKMVLEYD